MNRSRLIPRRGVTLMLVLALMTMFAMMAVTFMVVTTQFRSSAESIARIMLESESGAETSTSLPEAAVENVLVGGFENGNIIGAHSILENLYGHPNYYDVQNSDPYDKNLEVEITGAGFNNGYLELSSSGNDGGMEGPADLTGYILTVTQVASGADAGVAKKILGKSTIITASSIDLTATPPNVDFVTAPFYDTDLNDQANALDGSRCVINPQPFSGTGAGFDSSVVAGVPALTLEDNDLNANGIVDGSNGNANNSSLLLALRPNALAPDDDGQQRFKKYFENNFVMMNPDYTAPDYASMFLAWYDVVAPSGTGPAQIDDIIPSFHRPQLLRYWNDVKGSLFGSGNNYYSLLRRLVFRPLPVDHPGFSGSNHAMAWSDIEAFANNNSVSKGFDDILLDRLVNGPWDVDNDGDGIPDGIWIDAGLGTYTDSATGETYKMLASYLILDMDGRLNVNTHGNVDHDSNYVNFGNDPLTGSEYGGLEVRGFGSGPADLRLDMILTISQLNDLLKGNSTKGLQGRYGDTIGSGNPGVGNENTDTTALADKVMTMTGMNPYAYAGGQTGFGVGGLYPDLWGSTALAIDPLGNRFYNGPAAAPLFAANPYLSDPYASVDDAPFTPDELQLILRSPGDEDFTTLPTRFRALIDDNLYNDNLNRPDNRVDPALWSAYRLEFTTRSSDIPAMSLSGMATSGATFRSLYHYIRAITGNDSNAQDLFELLPAEIRRGEKVNLNRLTLHQDWARQAPTQAQHTDLLKEKARFAQEIYYLLATLAYDAIENQNYSETVAGTPLSKEQMYTRLAQWAVNLVDFIDPDSVMTPFVFSIDPINDRFNNTADMNTLLAGGGWAATGNVRLIWGVEKPEIALTETLAIHNRRVADAIAEGDPEEKQECSLCKRDLRLCSADCAGEGTNQHDFDFDQVKRPQGSLFVELYRQGNPNRGQYTNDFGIDASGLNLAETTPEPDSVPVWRIVVGKSFGPTTPEDIFKSGNWQKGTDDALHQSQMSPDYDFKLDDQWSDAGTTGLVPERFIWFTDSAPTVGGDVSARSYVRNDNSNVPRLQPNQYLVIGPRKTTSLFSSEGDPKDWDSYGQSGAAPDPDDFGGDTESEGYQDAMSKYNKTRIEIEEDQSSGKLVMYATSSKTDDPTDKDCVGVNVSEMMPYTEARKTPLWDGQELRGFGTIPCYKTVLLQRLADPRRSYDRDTNPYITVDWNMADLHVINSESSDKTSDAEPLSVEEEVYGDSRAKIPETDLYFYSRQWGRTGIDPAGTTKPKRPNLRDRTVDTAYRNTMAGLGGTESDRRNIELEEHSLGELNEYVLEGSLAQITADQATTFGTPLYGSYVGAPDPAFLHLPWNDAPLTNTLELLMIPTCSVQRLGVEFIDQETMEGAQTYYDTGTSLGTGGRFRNPESGLGPYLNFFSGDTAGSNTLDLARLFELVRVPSRFAGTITNWINNQPVYAMREPGKINLNTATGAAWDALTNADYGTRYGNYNVLRDARGGTHLTNTMPSEFAMPFRSPLAANLVPVQDMIRKPVDTTLLRENLSAAVATRTPFIEPHGPTSVSGSLVGSNPYTSLENVMRLSDVTTCRSNVFAVWVTVGYFKVEKFEKANLDSSVNDESNLFIKYPDLKTNFPQGTGSDEDKTFFEALYPDGYILGEERGINDGTVKRQRGFFLIDRSVPVGFRRGGRDSEGNKLNAKDVIIYKKILE